MNHIGEKIHHLDRQKTKQAKWPTSLVCTIFNRAAPSRFLQKQIARVKQQT